MLEALDEQQTCCAMLEACQYKQIVDCSKEKGCAPVGSYCLLHSKLLLL